MSQESNPVKDSLIPAQPIPAGRDEIFDRIAAGLYSLASMLVGEGEDGVRLVEIAVASAEVSVCHNPDEARKSSRRALSVAALDILSRRDPGSLAAPEGLKPAETCIEDDDLAAAGVSGDELERMIAGPDRDRMRKWLASLPTALRIIFVLRAVAGFTAAETATLLAAHGGPRAAGWTPAAVGELFRQGLCSLASQLIHASSTR
jgi:DNA-directed RNA polymerase specialized sigma24 family protein